MIYIYIYIYYWGSLAGIIVRGTTVTNPWCGPCLLLAAALPASGPFPLEAWDCVDGILLKWKRPTPLELRAIAVRQCKRWRYIEEIRSML